MFALRNGTLGRQTRPTVEVDLRKVVVCEDVFRAVLDMMMSSEPTGFINGRGNVVLGVFALSFLVRNACQ